MIKVINNAEQTPMSIYFEDKSEKSPDLDWRYKEIKHRNSALIQEDYNNSATWQINNQEKMMIEIYKDLDRILSMILDMRKSYKKYLDQANKIDNQYDQIQIRALRLE